MTTGAVPADQRALRRRWRAWRALRRTVAIVTWFVAISVTYALIEDGPTQSTLDFLTNSLVLLLVLWCWERLAKAVDYRYIDALCLFVPIYNILWSARIVWRLTYRVSPVPVRDWPPAAVRREMAVDRLARRLNPWST